MTATPCPPRQTAAPRSGRTRVLGAVAGLAVAAVALTGGVLPSSAHAAASVPATFSFSGGGWGHGVGLSQVGAYGMAAEGKNASQILTHYFTGTTVAPRTDAVDLRVNLLYSVTSMALRGEALGASGGAVEITVGSTVIKVPARDVATLKTSGSSVQVAVNGTVRATGNPVVVRWSGTRWPGSTGSRPAVLNVAGPGQNLDGNGHRYRYGRVEVRSRTNAAGNRTLSAVAVVNLHGEYLRGLGEMPSSWPMAALEAQVVAARNYAYAKYTAGIRQGCWCHVFDTTADQVYVGYGKEVGLAGERWRTAVANTSPTATTGQMVLYRGAPVQTFFFDSTAGRTEDSADIWGSAQPWLKSVDDHWSRDAKYNPGFSSWGPLVRTQAVVASAFGLKDVVRLTVSASNASGSPRTITATSSSGATATLSGSAMTARLSLTSHWHYRTGDVDPMAPRPAKPAPSTPAPTSPTPAAPAPTTPPALAKDPIAASVAASASVPLASRTIVIAAVPSATAVDQWVAMPLASSLRAPMLYTLPVGMSRAVAAEIHRRTPTTAYLIGSTTSVPQLIEQQLRKAGVTAIIRISAADRYSMSVAVASAMRTPKGRSVMVVNGRDTKSLNAVAPIAARTGRPVLLVRATSVPFGVGAFLSTHKPRTTTVSGPVGQVSDSVIRLLPNAVRAL